MALKDLKSRIKSYAWTDTKRWIITKFGPNININTKPNKPDFNIDFSISFINLWPKFESK